MPARRVVARSACVRAAHVDAVAVKRVVDHPMGADVPIMVSHVTTTTMSALPSLRLTIGDDEFAIEWEEARELRDALDAELAKFPDSD